MHTFLQGTAEPSSPVLLY